MESLKGLARSKHNPDHYSHHTKRPNDVNMDQKTNYDGQQGYRADTN